MSASQFQKRGKRPKHFVHSIIYRSAIKDTLLFTVSSNMMQPTAFNSTHDVPFVQHLSDDDDSNDPHAALVDNVRANTNSHRDALSYLVRYESMVRQQQADELATLDHIIPCLQRLQAMAGIPSSKHTDPAQFLQESVSFAQLSTAVNAMEESDNMEFLSTDRQLVMVLRMLSRQETPSCLTWAEVVQCYQVCCSGMATLQHLPTHPSRQRARDRTLSMISLFEGASSQVFGDDSVVKEVARVTANVPPRRRSGRGWMMGLVVLLVLVAGVTVFPVESIQENLPLILQQPRSMTSDSSVKKTVAANGRNQSRQPLAPHQYVDWSQHDSIQSMSLPATLGGAVGILLAPVGGLLPTLVFSLGTASMGSRVVRVLEALWDRLSSKSHRHVQ